MSVQEVENMTLAQKRMAAMIMENTVEDVEAHRARQAAAEAEAAAAVGGAGIGGEEDGVMDQSDDDEEERKKKEEEEEEERAREIERAKALRASAVNTAGPMKIRTDYIPKREFLCPFHPVYFFGAVITADFRLSWHEKFQGRDDDLFYLWATNSC
jgi:splicing factor 3A subunit 1